MHAGDGVVMLVHDEVVAMKALVPVVQSAKGRDTEVRVRTRADKRLEVSGDMVEVVVYLGLAGFDGCEGGFCGFRDVVLSS